MTASDIIQAALLIVTALGVFTSILISVSTLKQNSKMIEETTRPNIIIYKDIYNINSPMEFIVIKNVGGSLAHITNIIYDKDSLDKISGQFSKVSKAFEFLNNSYLAPSQSYKIPIKSKDSGVNNINIKLQYENDAKKYTNDFEINLKQDIGITYLQQHQSNNELKVISNAIQELIKRLS